MDDTKLTEISRYIEKARHDLLINGNDDAGALLFMGEVQDPIPRTLIIDPILNPVDIRTWMILRISIANPTIPSKLPTQVELARYIHCTKTTLWASLQILRLNRWVTLCERVRDAKGQNRGNIYIIHSEPMAIADTQALDNGYIDYVEHSLNAKTSRIRNNAMAIMIAMQRQINGNHPFTTTQLQQHDLRLKAIQPSHQTLVDDQSMDYYAANFAQMESKSGIDEECHWSEAAVHVNEESDQVQGSKIEPCENDKVQKLSPVNNGQGIKIEPCNTDRVQKLNPVENGVVEPFLQGLKIDTLSGRSCCSSNISLNITTTTTIQEKKLKSFDRFKKMLRPEDFPVVKKILFTIPEESQQDVLDQTLGRLVNYQKTGRGEIENMIGFMIALKRAVEQGEFMVDSHGLMIKSGREAEERHEKVAKNPSVKMTKIDSKTKPMDLEERQKGLDALNGLKRKMKF